MSTQTYPLSGLHCQACVRRVTDALVPHAAQVKVSLSPMQVELTDARTDLAQLQQAVSTAGNYALLAASGKRGHEPLAVEKSMQSAVRNAVAEPEESVLHTYLPLLLIVAYILVTSVLVQIGLHADHGMSAASSISLHETMRYFMAGFFLTFSFFKMLDLRAFANAYAGYELLAARWHGWGYVYPFIELALGLAYLANFASEATAWITLILMGFSSIGVIRAVASKKTIRCACLGTVFQLPMSTVTIIEDVGMVLMAAWILVGMP